MQMKLINDYLDMTSSAILFLFSDCHLLSVWSVPGPGEGEMARENNKALTLDNYRY